MSRKRCIRRIWTTAPGFNPVAHAIAGATGITEPELDKLRARELAAIDAMVSLMLVLAQWGYGVEGIEAAAQAQKHLDEDYRRWMATGRMGTTGPGLQSYRAAYEIHDLQRQCVTRKEYEQAIRLAMERTRQRHKALQAPQKESATHG